MTAQFLVKNFSDEFYEQVLKMSTLEAWKYLTELHQMKVKVGQYGSFSDRIELNKFIKSGKEFQSMKISKRRGYRLIIFNF